MSILITPHANDVSGRGNGVKNHSGNVLFRDLVVICKHDFIKFPKDRKYLISQIIYKEIKALTPPGRFLKEDENNRNNWVELDGRETFSKIGQALREDQPALKKEFVLPCHKRFKMKDEEIHLVCDRLKVQLKAMTHNKYANAQQSQSAHLKQSSQVKTITSATKAQTSMMALCPPPLSRMDRIMHESVSNGRCSTDRHEMTWNQLHDEVHSTQPARIPFPGIDAIALMSGYDRQYSCRSISIDEQFMATCKNVDTQMYWGNSSMFIHTD